MRVLIDATSLLLRSAGVKSYTWHWLRSLRTIAGGDTIRAFPFVPADRQLVHDRSILSPWATWPRLGAVFATNLLGTPALDALCRGVDVFHASNMVRVAPRRVRLTATLHDMTSWLMPELHTSGNVVADRYFADRILKQADRLIAVSQNTRDDAARVLGMDPSRIHVIHSGVDERFFNAQPLRRPRPYVLFLGTIEPRKNVDTLLDAWQQLDSDLRAAYELVIAGPAGWNAEATLARVQEAPGVTWLGYVAEAGIPGLTAGAAAFAYTSLYEGFGFPVAQAMAAGVPVVTSNTSCLPEIAGDGALLVDPRSTTETATALGRLLESPELRHRLGAAGRARAQAYRWDQCARRSLEFFAS